MNPIKLTDTEAVQAMLDVKQEGQRAALFTAATLTALYKQAMNDRRGPAHRHRRPDKGRLRRW